MSEQNQSGFTPNLPARRPWLTWRARLWPVTIAALIVVASHRPRLASPGGIPHLDKIVHFSVYGLLATLVVRNGGTSAKDSNWRAALWALALVSAFGASDEWHQSFVPGRSVELADWLADTLGAALAVGLYAGVARYRRCLETPLRPRRRAG